jgi:hypothetical protein
MLTYVYADCDLQAGVSTNSDSNNSDEKSSLVMKPLLVRAQDGQLHVNFDTTLTNMLREVRVHTYTCYEMCSY